MSTPTVTPASAATTAATPAPADVALFGWRQLTHLDEFTQLQQVLDASTGGHEWADMCAHAMKHHFETKSDVIDAATYVWERLYVFALVSGAVIGILVSKKVSSNASERHCAVLSKDGCDSPLAADTTRVLRHFIALVKED